MNSYADKKDINENRVVHSQRAQSSIQLKSAFYLKDNRPQAIAQRELVKSLNNGSSNIIQQKSNKTGMPDHLKSGIENLSGFSMDDVKVHYNSNKPAQLNAHAYAQGTHIHLASGQEKHLPHEAWHVVQQKQGRVKPTIQLKGKANVNDDKTLENEADVMGNLSLRISGQNGSVINSTPKNSKVVQRVVKKMDGKEIRYYSSNQEIVEPENIHYFTTVEEAQKIDNHFEEIVSRHRGSAAAESASSISAGSAAAESASSISAGSAPTESASSISSSPAAAHASSSSSSSSSAAAAAPSGLSEEEALRLAHHQHVNSLAVKFGTLPNAKTFFEAGPIFRKNIKTFKQILSNAQAVHAGFSGIVHFGTNKTIENTAGVVAKPHGLKAYGGAELNWSNTQKMIKLMEGKEMQAAIKHVRPVNNAPISAVRLEMALEDHELIYFHLNQFTPAIITALIKNDDKYKLGSFVPVNSVTGQEFIHIYTNWPRFSASVIFLKNLAPVERPW
jgi:hypothetical protein